MKAVCRSFLHINVCVDKQIAYTNTLILQTCETYEAYSKTDCHSPTSHAYACLTNLMSHQPHTPKPVSPTSCLTNLMSTTCLTNHMSHQPCVSPTSCLTNHISTTCLSNLMSHQLHVSPTSCLTNLMSHQPHIYNLSHQPVSPTSCLTKLMSHQPHIYNLSHQPVSSTCLTNLMSHQPHVSPTSHLLPVSPTSCLTNFTRLLFCLTNLMSTTCLTKLKCLLPVSPTSYVYCLSHQSNISHWNSHGQSDTLMLTKDLSMLINLHYWHD